MFTKQIKTNIKYLFVAVVVIFLVMVGFFAWQRDWIIIPKSFPKLFLDGTANWKIYTNSKYGFEFKYPGEWIFDEEQTGGTSDFLDIHLSNFKPSGNFACDSNYIGLEIQVGLNKNQEQDFAEFVKSQLNKGLGSPNGSTEEMLVDKHRAFKAEFSGWGSACAGPGYLIEQDKSHYIYIFTGSNSDNQKETQKRFDQILSTFKFIEVKNETLGWKTYQNTKHGYEFKYPEGTDILSKSGQLVEMGNSEFSPYDSLTIYELKQEERRFYLQDDPRIKIEVVTGDWLDKNYPNLKFEVGMNIRTFTASDGRTVIEVENFAEDCYKMLVAGNKEENITLVVRQNKKTEFLDSIFKTFTLIDREQTSVAPKLIEKSFSYPYPVSWDEDGINFSLTGISLGKTPAPEKLIKSSGGYYKEGEEVNALTLILKIRNSTNIPKCVDLNIRKELNEKGDLAAPNTDQFHFPGSHGCIIYENTSYPSQKVLFVVSESEKSFNITTGGKSNKFFTINVLEADGIIREQPILELEKSIEEEGLRQLIPYNADVSFCYDAGQNKYKTTGQSSEFQNWFVFGDCPRAKYYRVVPGKEMILNIKTDIGSCSDCVCNYPEFSLYEYKNGNFQKAKDFSFSNIGGVAEKVYYTPSSEKIKIEANKCFYLDVFQAGETYLSRLSLNSPNGGEQLEVGKTYRIIWSSSGTSGNIDIELVNKDCVEGGNNCIGWPLDLNRTPISRGLYEWKIDGLPMGVDYSKYKIHIWSNNNVYIDDYSDNYFSIVKNIDIAKPYIKLTSPVGGEKWYFGQMQTITWKSNLRGHVAVYLAFPDGGMCNVGSTLAVNGTFSFFLKENMSCVIPQNITAGTYKVALVADNDTEFDYLYAYSDGNITISATK